VTARPVDWIIAVYNVVLLGVWLPLVPSDGTARWLAGVHLVALAVPVLLARTGERAGRLGRAARTLYPLLLLMVFWRELGVHCGLVGSAANDLAITTWERSLFGGVLSSVWMPAMPRLWFSETMEAFYFSYYVFLLAVPAWSLVRGDRASREDVVLRVALAYTACFLLYAVAPTAGPMFMFPRYVGENAHGLFRTVNDFLRETGDAAGTAFPSSHVAGIVTLAWVAWRHLPRPVAFAATVSALGVAPATVYTQNHFVLDAIVGAAIGVGLQLAVAPVLAWLGAPRRTGTRGLMPASEPEAA